MTDKFNQDGSINENWLAEHIAELEGKKESQDIGQIKETLKITLDTLYKLREEDMEKFDALIEKHA